MQIWIVFGCSGDYEDYKDEIVGVFDAEDKAIAFVEAKEKVLDDLGLHAYGMNHNCSKVENEGYQHEADVLAKLGKIPMGYGGSWLSISGPEEVQ